MRLVASGDAGNAAAPGAVPGEAGLRAEVESLLRRGLTDRARDALDAQLATAPDDVETLSLRAHVALEELDVDGARALIDRALAIDPASSFARLQLADYWLRLGVTPRARAELQQALHDCDGKDPALEAHLRQAIVLVRRHTKTEFGGVEAAGGFRSLGRAVHRLFLTKRARRRLDRLAGVAVADERGA